MSIGPLLPGRLPNSLASSRLQNSLASINRELARLQDQSATGQKFFLPSDSPTAALRTIGLQRALERQDHFKTTIQADEAFLTATETALDTSANAANRAKAIVLAGIGTASTPSEKAALSSEVSSLIRSVVNSANTQLRGRYIFAGSDSSQPPFEIVDDGIVRYNGDAASLDTRLGADLRLASNLNGHEAFAALSEPVTRDVDPALTLDTRVRDLLSGRGVALGTIRVTVDDGVNPAVTRDVDLTGAETTRDLKTRLEAAFDPGALTVDIDPTNNNGLRLAAAATVQVTDLAGSNVAERLGIRGGPVATITGGDLDPRITLQTKLSDLNGGAGLADATDTFVITNGAKSATIDVSTATTVEDLFNLIELADVDVATGINEAGDGLAIRSRLSGAQFSIGENGGTTAGDLGVRTFTGQTRLADLNRGQGVSFPNPAKLNLRLNDGSTAEIDVSSAVTIQDVINAVNAFGNPNLQARLNTVGNGIELADSSVGTAGFAIEENAVSTSLGLGGSLSGAGTLSGTDVNPQENKGLLGLLLGLRRALDTENDAELQRIDSRLASEVERVNLARGEVGNRLNFLDDLTNRLEDQNVFLQESLSTEFDADMTEVITRLVQTQQVLQATLQIASRTQELSLLNFL